MSYKYLHISFSMWWFKPFGNETRNFQEEGVHQLLPSQWFVMTKIKRVPSFPSNSASQQAFHPNIIILAKLLFLFVFVSFFYIIAVTKWWPPTPCSLFLLTLLNGLVLWELVAHMSPFHVYVVYMADDYNFACNEGWLSKPSCVES